MNRAQRLAEHVRARVSGPRIDGQWAAIEHAGLPGAVPARSRRAVWLGPVLALAAGIAALLVWYARTPPSLPPGALIGSARAGVAVQLDDGSRVELSPSSQLMLLENRAQSVALELRSGKARFHVTRDRARPFQVRAGELLVHVVGTRFELARTREAGGTLVRVAVSEGVVEVKRRDGAGELRRLGAGESWSALIADAQPPRPPQTAAAAAHEPAAHEPAAHEPTAHDEPLAPEPAAIDDGRAAGARERDASALFRRASLARRAGRMSEAAEGYAELLARHPADARAGLSAFELGRIRMDALGDHVGAIAALERAVAAGSSASFHEDALARIVVASDALGRGEACRAARARYLEHYPRGVHASALAVRCR